LCTSVFLIIRLRGLDGIELTYAAAYTPLHSSPAYTAWGGYCISCPKTLQTQDPTGEKAFWTNIKKY
jgi:hypothetical protein